MNIEDEATRYVQTRKSNNTADPKLYKKALEMLGLNASEVLMAASHGFDLDAAHKLGFKTALIVRETETIMPLKHVPNLIVNGLYHLHNELLRYENS